MATWVGTVCTAVGLGSLIAQSSTITDQLDPFYQFRNQEHLGLWANRQKHPPWYRLSQHPPTGPHVTASFPFGFCGSNTILMSSNPTTSVGKAGWTVLLAVLHPDTGHPKAPSPGDLQNEKQPTHDVNLAEKGEIKRQISGSSQEWSHLRPLKPLHRHDGSACLAIERRTFIALLSIQNGRAQFNYSAAAGLRASYPAYNGIW